MSIRPLNTLTCDEVFQLLQAPGFYDFLEFAYLMYIEHLVAQFNNFVVRDPPAPAIAPGFNDGLAAPIPDIGTPNVWADAEPISGGLVAGTLAQEAPPMIPQQLSSVQLSGSGADRVAPFDMEAAPMQPGINVGNDYSFTTPALTDLGTGSGMNDNWYSHSGTALYTGTAQEPGAIQQQPTSFDPLSVPAQTPVMMSPGSDVSMRDASDSDSDSAPFSSSSAHNGGLYN